MTIKNDITLPTTSTATFAVKGDIIVTEDVGESILSSTTTSIDGFYSAGGNFIVRGINDCAISPDLRLNIGGTVVANANLKGGGLDLRRDLCGSNKDFPTLYFAERLDLILNAPRLIKIKRSVAKEVAPK